MIRYALRCGRGHKFEAWFRDSKTYDMQAASGEVVCPHCGVIDIEKDLMAPNVQTAKAQKPQMVAEPAIASEAAPRETVLAPTDKRQAMLIEAMQRLRDTILKEAEYVGDQFSTEARRLAEEDAPAHKPIYGEATAQEVQELLEEGIKVLPIPAIPKDHN